MKQPLILIIDHSPATRTMYADYLRHHGYVVLVAANAVEGARCCRDHRPDLIVTELYEEGEWAQAIRVARGGGAPGHTPVIACSTLIERHWPNVPSAIGIDSALAKPVSPRAVLGEVERLLGRSASAGALSLYLEPAAVSCMGRSAAS